MSQIAAICIGNISKDPVLEQSEKGKSFAELILKIDQLPDREGKIYHT